MWNFTTNYCERISKNTEKIIEKNGYCYEKHEITTKDGYINCMYRIYQPKGKNLETNVSGASPVMLLHGMNCSCAVFLNQSHLAYYLVDQGFDVWLPNNRGSTFSRKHVNSNIQNNSEKFWNFSWHEMGVYDIPAFVDYVLEQTGFEKIRLIGHSQGATVAAVFLSELPQYNEKVALTCLLGPAIIYSYNQAYQLRLFSDLVIRILETTHKLLKLPLYEIPLISIIRALGAYTKPKTLFHKITEFCFSIVAGHADYDQISKLDYRQFSLTTPNTSSIKQAYHYGQIIRNRKFAQYDYGPDKNMKVYKRKDPPLYDLSKIKSPVALYYGKNDMFTSYEDNLENILPNVVEKYVVDHELFNHIDFLFGKDSIKLVYTHISTILKKYED